MLILEAPSKRRAVFSGYSVYIGGFPDRSVQSRSEQALLNELETCGARYEGAHSVNATSFKIRFRKECRFDSTTAPPS